MQRVVFESADYLYSMMLGSGDSAKTELELMAMRDQGMRIWESYFSDMTSIVMTTLKIIENRLHRIDQFPQKSDKDWNFGTTSLSMPSLMLFSPNPGFSIPTINDVGNLHNFTLILKLCLTPWTTPEELIDSLDIWRERIADIHKLVDRILVLVPQKEALYNRVKVLASIWRKSKTMPKISAIPWNEYRVSGSGDFLKKQLSATPSVCVINVERKIPPNIILTMFNLWKSFPNRLISTSGYNHYWNDVKRRFQLSPSPINELSLADSEFIFVPRSFITTNLVNWEKLDGWCSNFAGDTVLFNFLALHSTGLTPIIAVNEVSGDAVKLSQRLNYLKRAEECFNAVTDLIGGATWFPRTALAIESLGK